MTGIEAGTGNSTPLETSNEESLERLKEVWDLFTRVTMAWKTASHWKRTGGKILSADADEVHMFFPSSQKNITLGAKFPNVESRDAFLQSERGVEEAIKYGLDFGFFLPNSGYETLEGAEEELNDDLLITPRKGLAEKLGVSEEELREAFFMGAKAFIRYYIKKDPPNPYPFPI